MDYVTWQDLIDDEAPDAEAAPESDRSDAAPEAREARPAVALPADVLALMGEQRRLEERLKILTGAAEAPADARMAKCFPVRAHTKESRIEDRRVARHDERLRTLEARARAEHVSRRKAEEQRLAAQELVRREEIEARLASARVHERAREMEADRARRALEEEQLRAVWAARQQAALLAAQATARRERAWQEERDADQRRAATEAQILTARARADEQDARDGHLERLRALGNAANITRRTETRATDAHADARRRAAADDQLARRHRAHAEYREWQQRRTTARRSNEGG